MPKKISFEEAQCEIRKKWPYLKLDRETFQSIKKPCKIFDEDFGEFYTSVKNLLAGRSHPGHRERFRQKIQEIGSQAGQKAYQNYLQKNALTPEESQQQIAEKRKHRRKLEAEERKEELMQQYGVEYKHHTPQYKERKSKQARQQGLGTRIRPAQTKSLVQYFTSDGNVPYYVKSDAVGWNRDAARQYFRKYGEDAFIQACESYSGPRNLLETDCLKNLPVQDFNRKKLTHYRPDFLVTETCFMNIDGLWWHGEMNLPKYYHFNMRQEFEANNLRILQIREDEYRHKQPIIQSILKSILKQNQTIYARKCQLAYKIPIQEALQFLNENHMMGARLFCQHIGLFHQGQLVALMSCSFQKDANVLKVERFCSMCDTNVVGGFSKLLKAHLQRGHFKKVQSWVDLRYATGASLEQNGFVQKRETLGWKWADRNTVQTFNRTRCRANMDQRGLSEREHADELKWFKIYDAGQRLYEKEL